MKQYARYWPQIWIIFLWFLFCSPYFLKGLVPFPSTYLVSFFPPWNAYYGMPVKNNAMPDIVTQIFPWKKLTIDTWKQGEIPLWNPYSFSGTVHAANYQSAVFSPVNLLFFIFSFLDAWSLSVLLQPLVAGLGMIFFLRVLGVSHAASVLGSVSFMFCGFMTTWMGYGTLGWAIAVLPLSLGAVVGYGTHKFWWSGVLLSGSVAFSFLSGHYQISMYLLFAVLFFILGTRKKWKERGALVGFALLGVGIALPQLLLTFMAFFQSNRSESFTSGAIPWKYLATLFAPDVFGNPVTRNDWFGQYAEWASYIGVVPLISAVYALFSPKSQEKRILVVLLGISLLVSFATPINTLLYLLKIPIISTSVATRMIVLASFSLAVLGAFGLDDLIHDWKEKRFGRMKTLTLLGSIFLGLWWTSILITPLIPGEHLSIAKRNSMLPSGLMFVTVGIFFFGSMFPKLRVLFLGALLITASVDSYRFVSKWMPFEPKEYVYPDSPIIGTIQSTIGYNRLYGTFGNELNTFYGIPSIEGYDAMYLKRYGEFMSSSHDGSIGKLERSVVHLDKAGKYSEHILRLLGARFILHRTSDGRNVWAYPYWKYPSYQKVYDDGKYELYEHNERFSRAFLASAFVIETEQNHILDRMFVDTQRGKETLVLEQEPSMKPEAGAGNVTIISATPTRVVLAGQSETPKLLFLADAYSDGWKAKVNGTIVPILRANYAFRAVEVPAGKWHVRFEYCPVEFTMGLVGSGISLFVLIVVNMRQLRHGRRHL